MGAVEHPASAIQGDRQEMNDLQRFFDFHNSRLIHKWMHYFEIYDRHFSRFLAYSLSYYDSILALEKRSISRPVHRMTGHPSFDAADIAPVMTQLAAKAAPLQFELYRASDSINPVFERANLTATIEGKQLLKAELDQLRLEHQQRELQQQQILVAAQTQQAQMIEQMANLVASQHQLQTQVERMQTNLHQKQEKIKALRSKRRVLQQELFVSEEEIAAIKASKL